MYRRKSPFRCWVSQDWSWPIFAERFSRQRVLEDFFDIKTLKRSKFEPFARFTHFSRHIFPRNLFPFQSILNEVGRPLSKKAKQPTSSTANEEEAAARVDISQAGTAQHPSKSTEILSVSRVPPFSVANSSINTKRNPSKAAASTSKLINLSSRVLRSHRTIN